MDQLQANRLAIEGLRDNQQQDAIMEQLQANQNAIEGLIANQQQDANITQLQSNQNALMEGLRANQLAFTEGLRANQRAFIEDLIDNRMALITGLERINENNLRLPAMEESSDEESLYKDTLESLTDEPIVQLRDIEDELIVQPQSIGINFDKDELEMMDNMGYPRINELKIETLKEIDDKLFYNIHNNITQSYLINKKPFKTEDDEEELENLKEENRFLNKYRAALEVFKSTFGITNFDYEFNINKDELEMLDSMGYPRPIDFRYNNPERIEELRKKIYSDLEKNTKEKKN